MAEDTRHGRAHLVALGDHVDHPVLEQELRALEALGQRLLDRLLENTRACEADQGLRLGTFVGVVVSAALALTFFALVACARGAPE